MRATPNLDFTKANLTQGWLQQFVEMIKKIYQNLTLVINGNLGFGDGTNADNVKGVWSNVTAPATPNTDFTITHNLGSIPVGYWVMQADRATDIYTGSVAATKTQLTLRSSVASAVLRIFIVCLILALAPLGRAQTTNLTIQVTDAGGQSWNNGTWSVTLASPPGVIPFGPPFFLTGTTTPVPNQTQNGALSGTGSATMTLTQNAGILPTGSQWRFLVCPNATSVCFTQFVLVTATTSATITPPVINVQPGPGALAQAYSDSEVQGTATGNRYYNVTSTQERVCTVVTAGVCTVWTVAGTGAGGAAAGAPVQMQVNAGGGPPNTFGGTNCTTLDAFPSTTQERHDCDTHFKGPNPYTDVTRFGVRAVSPNVTPAAVGLTANCNSGNTSVVISSASTFINGDGVVLYGCGAAQTLTTPTAPIVVPSVAAAMTGVEEAVAGPSGSTTNCYKIMARDKLGGMTAASPETCTSTAQASLGAQSVGISSITRANDVVTVTTSAAHTLATGAMVLINVTAGDSTWHGWFQVSGSADNTHFTYTSGQDTRNGAQSVVNGSITATVNWFNCNHVTWSQVTGAWLYYIYKGSTGAETLYGVSRPNDSNINLAWDDFGTPMMGGMSFPAYVPNTPPVSATSDHLVTTISSGAGTTTLVLSNAPSTTVTGATIRFDNAPNLFTAAQQSLNTNATGSIYVPPSGNTSNYYVVNSFLDFIPVSNSGVMLITPGQLWLNDTIQLGTGSRWYGEPFPVRGNFSSFDFSTKSFVQVNAYPGVYVKSPGPDSIAFKGLDFNSNFNNYSLLVLLDSGAGTTSGHSFDEVTFTLTGANNDYMGIGLYTRSINWIHLNKVSLVGGPGQVNGSSATPLLVCNPCGSTNFENLVLNRRGLLLRPSLSGFDNRLHWMYEQGGITPMVTVIGSTTGIAGAFLEMTHLSLDTMAMPALTYLPSSGGAATVTASITSTSCPSFAGGNQPGLVSGNRLRSFVLSDAFCPVIGQNRDSGISAMSVTNASGMYVSGSQGSNDGVASQQPNFSFGHPSFASMGVLLPTPAAPTVVASAGGSVPVGAHTWTVAWTDAFNNFSVAGPGASLTVANPNNTVTVTPVGAPSGAVGFVVFRDTLLMSPTGSGNTCGPFQIGTSFVDTSGNSNPCSNVNSPTTGTAISSGASTTGLATQANILTGNGFTSTETGSFTANRAIARPDGNGMIAVSGNFQSAYDNFNRANSGSLGSNWTTDVGSGFQVSGNQVTFVAATRASAFWNANTPFYPDQFSQMVITTYGNNLGPAVRASTPSGGNDYDCVVNSTTMFLQRIVGGAVGGLTSVGITGVSGDVIRLEVVGSPPQLSCFQNGVLRLGPFTDNLAGFLTSGQPGISGIGIGGAIGDNWSGGSLQPIAQLVVEQDWTQPQHFIQPITVGPTNPIAGTLAANTLYVPNVVASTFKTGNAAPTCASTGLGTGGTCGNFATGSDDISGNFLMTAGTTASATGTITLTFNVASVGNAFCTIYLSNQTAAWAATATSFPIFGTSTNQAVWANGGVSLVNTNQYAVGYFCSRH